MTKAIKTFTLLFLLPIFLKAQFTRHILSNAFDDVKESAIGDIDGDGDMDIFFYYNGLKWFEQVNINQNNWALHEIGGSSGKLNLIDVDHDGDLDFVVHKNGKLIYYENLNSLGTETIYHSVFQFSNLGTYKMTELVDLDSDGDFDFVSDGLAWAENIDGYFTFGDEQLIYDVPEEHRMTLDLNFVDWDEDSFVDIVVNMEVVEDEYLNQIQLVRNLGNGLFSSPEVLVDTFQSFILAFTRIADVDLDNDIDVIVHNGPNDVVWFRNEGDHFSDAIFINEYYDVPGDMEVVDMNNDGLPDIFWCGHGGVFWKPNLGNFTFDADPIELGPDQANKATNEMTFGDLDQDGDLDMLRMGRAIGSFPQRFSWYENKFPITSLNIKECESYTSPSGNHTWSESGTYLDTLMDMNGGDSAIIVVVLEINDINTNLINSNLDLTSFVPGATYQWLDCDSSYAPISGANEQFYVPSISGNYAVQINDGSCIDTSICGNISLVDADNDGFYAFEDCDDSNPAINPDAIEIPNNGIDEDCMNGDSIYVSSHEELDELVFIYPNPAKRTIHVENMDLIAHDYQITLITLNGKLIKELNVNGNDNIDIGNIDPGFYYIVFRSAGNKLMKPLIFMNE